MFDFDQDMKLTFLEEAQALLDEIEAAFMALDSTSFRIWSYF